MSSVSLMECNGKPPLQWDWENLIMFNSTAADNSKRMLTTVWGIDGERCFDSGSFYSSAGVSRSGGSRSDFPLTPLSKSPNSASISSSSIGDAKSSKPTLDSSDAIQEKIPCGKSFLKVNSASTSALETSVGSGEPLLTLKLGKRAYFEDVGTVTNARSSAFTGIPVSSTGSTKRSKSGSQGMHAPHCQVEGCNLDLSSAKDYHRKHRVCESHSKCPKVIVAGLERRFCQQCSRFHGLSEFDEKKRSCRRRLSDHNARRRKPQPNYVQLDAARMSSSFYDDRQQISFAWSKASHAQARPKANYSWEDCSSSKFTITKLKPANFDSAQIQLPASQLTNSIPMHGHDANGLLSPISKGASLDVLNQDLEESIINSNVDATQDLHRALSLLSTNTWGLSDSKSTPLERPARASHNGMPQSLLPMIPQGLPVSSLGSLRTEHQQIDAQVQTFTSTPFEFQEFQFPRTSYEGDFYSSQLN